MVSRILLLLLLVFPLLAHPDPVDDAVREQLRLRVETIRSGTGLQVEGVGLSSVIVLPALYEQRGFAPVWSNPQSVEQFFETLNNIDADGLDAADYHLAELETLRAGLDAGTGTSPAQRADFDLLLTDSLIRLGYHLLLGKVDPVELDSHWNMNHSIEGVETVLKMAPAIDAGNVHKLIESLRPQHSYYRNLKLALARYRAIAEQGGWQAVPAGPVLKPGMSDPRVIALRHRLAVTEELPPPSGDSAVFDDALETGVKRFQARHGLTPDGVVGKATIAALNVPVQARIDQIRVNLERARWVLHDLPDEFVLADIAGFTVRYFRNNDLIFEARAQVGKPYRTTPVFRSEIKYLVMNPTWTVPPTILRQDTLPAIQKDPEYLRKKNMRVIDYDGKPIDEASIDWAKYNGSNFPYLIRQEPGPQNALGRIKFMFPNEHAVYLHDTPSKSLFNRSGGRAFSSGCIRVENPYRLAELLLDDTGKWGPDAILQAVDSRQTRSVTLPRPVTVILLYWTVAADEQGAVIFKPDIYNRDAPILAGLQSRFRFRQRPVFNVEP